MIVTCETSYECTMCMDTDQTEHWKPLLLNFRINHGVKGEHKLLVN